MKPQEKIYKVLEILKEKSELSPKGAVIEYRAGEETFHLNADEEIMILNKLADEGVIEVVDNFAGEYI